jgi:hypothetical protein
MSKHSYRGVVAVLVVGLLLPAVLATVLVAQTPTLTPTVTASGEPPRPPVLGLGFGGAQKPQATPIPSKALSGEENSLARVAGRIKLRKLTAEDRKQIREGGAASSAPTEDNKPGEPSGTQTQREEAMAEYNETTGPLFQQVQQARSECRACSWACEGRTQGSTISTDSNGNLVVSYTSIDNSTTPACKNCVVMCYENLSNLARRINAARDTAASKGVFRHELDSGRLVFSNVKD